MLTSYVVNGTILKIMDLTKDIECILIDLDGTIYFGTRLIKGALEAIERMRKNKRVIFLTNNSSATREFYVNKLCGMGIPVTVEDIYTSANATQDWIKKNRPHSRIYVVGSPAVIDEFCQNGLNVDDKNPNTVVLTFDKTLTFDKLARCCDLIKNGAYYIATHPDMTCPIDGGELPDIGSFMRLIEGTTNKIPDLICGKPHSVIADCVAEMTGIPLNKTAMIGDRLTTDMKFAIDNGLKSVLTLTGETDMDAYLKSGLKVDKIINSVAEWDL